MVPDFSECNIVENIKQNSTEVQFSHYSLYNILLYNIITKWYIYE